MAKTNRSISPLQLSIGFLIIFITVIAFSASRKEKFDIEIDVNKLSCKNYLETEPALRTIWNNIRGNREREEIVAYLDRAMKSTLTANGQTLADSESCVVTDATRNTLNINQRCEMRDFNQRLTPSDSSIQPSGCVVNPREPWFLDFLDRAFYWKNIQYVNQIRDLRTENTNLSGQNTVLSNDRTRLERDLRSTQGQVSSLTSQIGAANQQVSSLSSTIQRLQEENRQLLLRGSLRGPIVNQLYAALSPYMHEFKNPSFYEYTLDDGSTQNIWDGGADMYDGGNSTHIMVNNGFYTVSYNNTRGATSTLNGIQVEHLSMGYIRPLMYFCKSPTRAQLGFRKTGNQGADGWGNTRTDVVFNDARIRSFRVFAWRRITWNAGDPSICDLFFALGDETSTFYSSSMNAWGSGSTDDNLCYFTMDTANVLFGTILLSKPRGSFIGVDECMSVMYSIINRMP